MLYSVKPAPDKPVCKVNSTASFMPSPVKYSAKKYNKVIRKYRKSINVFNDALKMDLLGYFVVNRAIRKKINEQHKKNIKYIDIKEIKLNRMKGQLSINVSLNNDKMILSDPFLNNEINDLYKIITELKKGANNV